VSGTALAALIAAAFFAIGVCVACYLLLRLSRLVSEATATLADYRKRADALVEDAQAAVDRAHQQLARTDSITASMDEVTANMAELSGHVSALAGLARGISAGVGAPLVRLAALGYGLRRAIAVRRLTSAGDAGRLTSARDAGRLTSARDAGRRALTGGGDGTREAPR
jgi:type II secretory pathway component PulL